MMPARVILTAVFLTAAACGSETGASDTAKGDRTDVILGYGEALLRGDVAAMSTYLEPSVQETWIESDVYSGLSEIPVDSKIEVNNLSFEILVDDGSRVEVAYLGERCARTVENQFSNTTVTDDQSNADGTVNSGTVVYGEVECFEIGGDRSADASFVAVSGRWFVELLVDLPL